MDGITPTDILALPEPFDKFLRLLMRQGSMTIEQIAVQLGLTDEQAQSLADIFVSKGYLRTEAIASEEEEESGTGTVYRVYLARMRKQNIPIDL